MKTLHKSVTSLTTALLLLGLCACGGTPSTAADKTEEPAAAPTAAVSTQAAATDAPAAGEKSDAFIAEREMVIQAFVDDIGYSLPDDQANNPVFQELQKRTGIKLTVQYTPGDSDRNVMATQLAAGNIPDAICSYLNDSTRPEFPLLLKGAQDGMFADLAPFIQNSKTYSKYLQDGYLPNDAKKNVMFRDDFGGKVYFMQLAIAREDTSTTFKPDQDLVGGMYIQSKIAEALKLDTKSIHTQDQLYDLLKQIKAGDFKDDNGNPVFPLGPKFWGGSVDSLAFVMRGYDWGVSDGYNLKDGKVLHEAQTEWAMKKVNFMRKLLAEELVNPEFFTMDSTRAEEVSKTHNSAIMADCHNYMPIVYESEDWLPLGPLDDWQGVRDDVTSGKSGYGVWAVSSGAKNPEEIFKLFDYMATKEGQLLCQYGVEGLSYTMVEGMPKLTDEVLKWINDGDNKSLINKVGAGFAGRGCVFFDYMLTDTDARNDFGEVRPGSGASETFARATEIGTQYPKTIRKVEGLSATAYLTDPSLADVKAQMDLLNYKETLTQAMFAPTDAEAQKIMDTFVEQIEAAGIEKFEQKVEEVYTSDPKAVKFY